MHRGRHRDDRAARRARIVEYQTSIDKRDVGVGRRAVVVEHDGGEGSQRRGDIRGAGRARIVEGQRGGSLQGDGRAAGGGIIAEGRCRIVGAGDVGRTGGGRTGELQRIVVEDSGRTRRGIEVEGDETRGGIRDVGGAGSRVVVEVHRRVVRD